MVFHAVHSSFVFSHSIFVVNTFTSFSMLMQINIPWQHTHKKKKIYGHCLSNSVSFAQHIFSACANSDREEGGGGILLLSAQN